jgi:hypothetical protein
MVDDVDATHRDYAEKGCHRRRSAEAGHDSFDLPGPDGWATWVMPCGKT